MSKRNYSLGFSGAGEYHYFILLFVVTLPFKNALSNLALISLILYVIFSAITRRVRYTFEFESLKSFKFLPLLFFILTLSLLYSSNIARGLNLIQGIAALLIIPVVFSFVNFDSRDKKLLFYAFMLSNLAAVFINIGRAMYRSIHVVEGDLVFDASVLGGQTFWYSIVQGGNYFFYDELSYFMHPTYWAIYLLFCVFIILDNFPGKDSMIKVVLNGLLLLFFLTAIFLCSSRIVIASAMALLSFYLILTLLKRKHFYWLIPCGGVIAVSSFILLTNPRFVGFSSLSELEVFHHARLETWRSAFDVFKESPIAGVGIGDSEEHLFSKYLLRNYQEGYQNHLNEHNQYLQIANSSGLIGLVFFLLALGSGFKRALVKKDFILFSFIASIAAVCIVENFLIRRAGVVYFSLFYCLLMYPEEK